MIPQPLAPHRSRPALRRRELLGTARLDHWTGALQGVPRELLLPVDRPRPAVGSGRVAAYGFRVDAELSTRLAELAHASGTTLFMVLQAGVAALLTRLGAGDDVPIGTVVALDDPVGSSNTVVLRTDLSGDPTFAELLARVREADLAAFAHQDIPFERVAEAVDPTGHPLFRVMVVLRDDSGPEVHADASGLDLLFDFAETSAGLGGAIEYATDLFDRSTVDALAARLVRVLTRAAAEPDVRIGGIDVLDAEERHVLGVAWNSTDVDVPANRCLHELFEDQALCTPDSIAVVHEGAGIPYAELNAAANRLAHHLVRRGVRPGDLVGVHLGRGPELVAALLAVLKAGAGYVVLDEGFPVERLTGVRTVITRRGPEDVPVERVELDWAVIGREPTDDLVGLGHPDAVARVGSRGVATSHRALIGTYLGQDQLRFGPDEVFLQCSPVSGDAFALEVFGPLLFGGTTVLRAEPSSLAALVAAHGVTALRMSAGLFNLVVDEHPEVFRVVRQVMTVGEPASAAHVGKVLRDFPGVRVVNGYGLAESTGTTIAHEVVRSDLDGHSVPIGRPVGNKRAYVLDHGLGLVPVGVVGELYVGGIGLAQGYAGRPGLTAERFVASPFGVGERLYRTGDLARWTTRGVLEHVGRVEVRGFRVEPAAVEAALVRHAGVDRAAVVVREDRLVAYVVGTADVGGLGEHLVGLLPEHAIPAEFVAVDALPLTANGKVDGEALPRPVRHRRAG